MSIEINNVPYFMRLLGAKVVINSHQVPLSTKDNLISIDDNLPQYRTMVHYFGGKSNTLWINTPEESNVLYFERKSERQNLLLIFFYLLSTFPVFQLVFMRSLPYIFLFIIGQVLIIFNMYQQDFVLVEK